MQKTQILQILQISQILQIYCRNRRYCVYHGIIQERYRTPSQELHLFQISRNNLNERFRYCKYCRYCKFTDILQKSQILQIVQNYPNERFRTPITEIADTANIADIADFAKITDILQKLQIPKFYCRNRRYWKYRRIIQKRNGTPTVEITDIANSAELSK